MRTFVAIVLLMVGVVLMLPGIVLMVAAMSLMSPTSPSLDCDSMVSTHNLKESEQQPVLH